MKSGKRQITVGIELANQERVRTLGEKENYMYLGILETNIIKRGDIKEKLQKGTIDERENFSKPSCEAGMSSEE